MKRKIFCLLAVLALLFSLAGCHKNENAAAGEDPAGTTAPEAESKAVEITVKEFNKHGNVILDTSFDSLKERDIEPGDVITVTVGDRQYDFPVGTSYSDVDSGAMVCRFDLEDQNVILAVNGGSFAETAGMAEKKAEPDESGSVWDVRTDRVSFELKEKKGYWDEYTIRSLERTNERSDYAELSDDDFANCREITTSGIRSGILFRGTTPIDPKLGRSGYAAKFIEAHQVRSVLNLNDTYEEMTGYDEYPGSYYSTCAILNSVMGYKFASEEFKANVRECVLFLAENDGPFYIHCKEGKDRSGILCAVLECFFGASLDEVSKDYIRTYENFYHITEESDTYGIIIKTNIEKTLTEMFGVGDLSAADLKKEAEEYLLSCGLTESDLSALTAKLGA